MQKERFKRPEPGFSMYEGRTRGKRIKYTYSDDEDVSYSDSTTRRSTRNTGTSTPAEAGPVTTSSGRQIRAPTRLNVTTGESAPNSVKGESPEFEKESSTGPGGRPKRSAAANQGANGWSETGAQSRGNTYGSDEEESEGDLGDDEEDADEHVPEESEDEDEFDEDEAMVDDDDLDDTRQSLVVKLSVTPPKLQTALSPESQRVADTPVRNIEVLDRNVDAPDTSQVEMEEAPAPQPSSISPHISEDKAASTILSKATTRDESAVPKATELAIEMPQSPLAVSATSLAFRGSPEKLHDQPPSHAVDVTGGE